MYLAGRGGTTRVVSTDGAGKGGCTAAGAGRGGSGVCVATLHLAGSGGSVSATLGRRIAESGAGNSGVIFLVGFSLARSNCNETTYSEEYSDFSSDIKIPNSNGQLLLAGLLVTSIMRISK